MGDAQRLWRALGFPESDGDPVFRQLDADALSRVAAIAQDGDLEFDTIVRMTRAVGQTMDRLAEWEVATILAALADTPSEVHLREQAMRLVQEVGPNFEALLVYAWRRHLAAAVARVESIEAASDEEQVARATVGFADLVAFSALTNGLRRPRSGTSSRSSRPAATTSWRGPTDGWSRRWVTRCSTSPTRRPRGWRSRGT